MIDEPTNDSEHRLAELEAEWGYEWLRAAIISRLEQLQLEGLWSDKRRAEFEALLQLTELFPPEYLRGAEFQAHSATWKNRMN
jgi:hypothetical protein